MAEIDPNKLERVTDSLEIRVREAITNPGGQLSLFPNEWTTRNAPTRAHQEAAAHEGGAADYLRGLGLEIWTPPTAGKLAERGRQHYENIKPYALELLKGAGLSDLDAAAVLKDYKAAAVGSFLYTSTPRIMYEAVRKLSPLACFVFDRYFYELIFKGFYSCVSLLDSFNKADGLGEIERLEWLANRMNIIPFGDASAVMWAACMYYITPRAFGANMGAAREFIRNAVYSGTWWNYCKYLNFTRSVLLATSEELAEVGRPTFPASWSENRPGAFEGFEDEQIEFYANWIGYRIDEDGQLLAEGSQMVQGSNALAKIGTGRPFVFRDIEKNRNYKGGSLDMWINARAQDGKINKTTADTILAVLKGVQHFRAEGRAIPPAPGGENYTIRTNLYDLSRACGLGNVNQEERNQIMDATLVLHNLEYMQLIRGARGKKSAGEWWPAIFFQWSGPGRESLIINVPRFYMEGENFMLIPKRTEAALHQAKRGKETRFMNIVIIATHKREDEIINEVWQFDRDKYEYKGGEASQEKDPKKIKEEEKKKKEAEKYRRYWRSHLAARRAEVAALFERAKESGAVTEARRTDGPGGAVWKWRTHTRTPATEPAENTEKKKKQKNTKSREK